MTLADLSRTEHLPLFAVMAIALACTPVPFTGGSAKARDADDLLIVDCLLPGKIQRLGNAATYVRGRKAIKTTARDCRIRGGEYTEEGEATYASLMKTWLPMAQQGDPEAQTNLGEIFEKGTGGPPQPDLAVQWYQLAAEQGYPRAQVNLGSLYERGLGVKQDQAKAIDLYRKASGLDSLNISYSPAAQSQVVTQLRAERDRLSIELAAERRQREALETELKAVSDRLRGERGSIQKIEGELSAARSELAQRDAALEQQRQRMAGIAADNAQRSEAELRLAHLEQQLETQRKVVAERDVQLRVLKGSIDQLENKAGTLQTRLAETEKQRDAALTYAQSARNTGAQQAVAQERSTAAGPLPVKEQLARKVNFGRYHALVIGNDNFKHIPKLRTAKRDAQVVADLLKNRYGFNTTVLLNADRYSLLSALNQLREKLTPEDNLLIYYAGHGELDRVNNRGYWLPIDAEAQSTANWIPAYQVTDILNAMSAKQVMLVADSCYSGMLTRSAIAQLNVGMTDDSKLRWYEAMATKHSRVVLTSGGVQPVLDGGGGEHSVFAKAFIETLESNSDILEGQKLAQEITRRVAISEDAAEIEQVPVYAPIRFAGHEAGDFFFIPRS